ncbi:hypothetical protein [Polaromonas sp. JS666]|uniref:hypothetical protein n=1 Tax=Polaromonas sp. (strain JS666 / ATCC BAA-500) TaxID=296591 RepID=UPI0000464C68|nr:hypothetical protein [Polaromonas sp. JS666]ABE45808.1 hypothetical protein Bpro_3913 [Polaromonas sp. JS666]
MIRLAWLFSAASVAVLVAACGGGDGGTAALISSEPIDKYVGNWTNCQATVVSGVNVSALTSFTATKTDATRGSFTTTVTVFAITSCTGLKLADPVPVPQLSGNVAIDSVGTGPSGSDKITITPSTLPSFKDLALVTGGQLQFGDAGSAKDAQGYPTALDSSFILTKQL